MKHKQQIDNTKKLYIFMQTLRVLSMKVGKD